MCKNRFSESQIAQNIKQVEGDPTSCTWRRITISCDQMSLPNPQPEL
jgi:hypothetical protein